MTKKLTLLFALMLSTLMASAHDIEVKNADGVTIYYNYFNNGTELAVTFQGDKYNSYNNEYTGNVVIPEEVTFMNRTRKVTSIGNYAFYDCSGLTSVTIGNSVTSIGDWAFYGCSGLTSITIPNSVKSIGIYAFSYCSGLTSIEIPNSVTSIAGGTFQDCSGLTSVTIPNSVTSIGSGAFYGTAWYNNQPEGLVYAGLVAYKYKGTMPENTSITIKEGTLGIGYGAFWDCSGLTSITIPNSVTSIGNYAFYYCSGLTSITIGNSVTSIGDRAFDGCSGLTSIEIPNSVTSIGYDAFSGTAWYNNQPDGLVYAGLVAYRYKGNMPENTSITIKEGTLVIGERAFYDRSGLTSVTIPNSVTSIGDWAFRECPGLTSITIPNSVKSIEYGAFEGCSGLTSVTIGNSVTSIGGEAFMYCSGLTSVTIGNSVTSIGVSAFRGCSGLTSITIPNSVTSIGSGAFSDCYGLTSIEIPNSVTSIGNYAFDGCSGLTKVTLNSNVLASKMYSYDSTLGSIFGSQVKEFILGNEVTSIGSCAFYYCKSLTSVTIPNSVKSIGDTAFGGCSGLTSFTIPNSVTVIEKSALEGCFGLTSVTIPNSVTAIGDYAFRNCSGLTSVTCEATSIPTTNSNAFTNVAQDRATLYVSRSALEDYKTTEPWSGFGTIVAIADVVVRGDANVDGEIGMPDVMFVVNDILGNPADTFNTEAADANLDGEIGMPDVMYIVQYILTDKFPQGGGKIVARVGTNYNYLDSVNYASTQGPEYYKVSEESPFYNKLQDHAYVTISPKTAAGRPNCRFNVPYVQSGVKYKVYLLTVPAISGDILDTENDYSTKYRVTMKYSYYGTDGKFHDDTIKPEDSTSSYVDVTTTTGDVEKRYLGTFSFDFSAQEVESSVVHLLFQSRQTGQNIEAKRIRLSAIIFEAE